ncbi:SPOSA6832_04788 [Sporobolomyces salmonicolor]|uniref:26S proteasome regulatory subunit RPN2 n=1 Tax=Sporidiobolus salmonicolor TaxID=5005 RepID=A0A0D6ETK7_SPOSA|nr:SPOSA6832_04788 [Sporobolomyces salmonicolor]
MVQSAQGLLSLLDEPEAALQAHALERINQLIDHFWAEVADHVVKIEALSESTAFPARQLASLVASKVYYHLGHLDEALSFALGAGKLFDIEGVSQAKEQARAEAEYVETVISKAIDHYVSSRSTSSATASDASTEVVPVDARLEAIVERMFERCERDGEYKQALGIALSSHRLDVVERIFTATKDASLLEWILQIVVREGVLVASSSRTYKNEVLHLLIKLYSSLSSPDYFAITQCFVYLNDPSLASSLLSSLLNLSTVSDKAKEPEEEKVLIAYQIAFDLAETATQEFLEVVRSSLSPATPVAPPVENNDAAAPAPEEKKDSHRERIVAILSGEESIKLYLEFLYRNNHADLLILKGTTASFDALEARNSIYHSAVSFMNAFAHAGTTSDLFLRENLDWLAKASNWSKFTTTAALGVIHKGNLAQGKAILEPYLPGATDGASRSVYSEGGSLYALGLVNANHGKESITGYLLETMKGSQEEVIQHELYDALRDVLFNDSAIAGEAAGYAMGLVMLGSGSAKALDEMLQYAHETQHEKIIRGLAVGIAFVLYGKEEEADAMVESLLGDAVRFCRALSRRAEALCTDREMDVQDAILRYGGVYTLALAYAGTGHNSAIRKLLHVAVSDVSDDVRRAAVTALGFLLFRNPQQVPRIVQLLSESYNPHVRYGSAMALGISCAGTGLEDAITLLEPLTRDPVDFVRQGACISLAMILIQQNDTSSPKVASVRSKYAKIVSDKHEDAMAKFGAALSQGIIDAGGRNVTISMQNKSGSGNMPAIVGMALFQQFWYWFPLAHCLSLAFTPTAIIGINKDLQIPKFDFVCNAKPSLFAYPPATKPPTKETVEMVKTADEGKPAAASDDAEMKDDSTAAPAATDGGDASTSTPSKQQSKRKTPHEPISFPVQNLSRVTPAQLPYISFPADARYVPVRPVVGGSSSSSTPSPAPSTTLPAASTASRPSTATTTPSGSRAIGGGILLVRDTKPTDEAELLELEVLKAIDTSGAAAAATAAEGAGGGQSDDELLTGPIAEVPPPFEWTDWE